MKEQMSEVVSRDIVLDTKINNKQNHWVEILIWNKQRILSGVRSRDILPAPSRERTPCVLVGTTWSSRGPRRWHMWSRWSGPTWLFSRAYHHTTTHQTSLSDSLPGMTLLLVIHAQYSYYNLYKVAMRPYKEQYAPTGPISSFPFQ